MSWWVDLGVPLPFDMRWCREHLLVQVGSHGPGVRKNDGKEEGKMHAEIVVIQRNWVDFQRWSNAEQSSSSFYNEKLDKVIP